MHVHRLAAGAAALILSTSATAETWAENRREFHAELARQCPDKHLDYMFQSTMLDVWDDYVGSLSPDKQAAFTKAADIDHACAEVIAGAGCANGANIKAATKLKLLPDFVKKLCAGPVSCPSKGGDACSEFPQS